MTARNEEKRMLRNCPSTIAAGAAIAAWPVVAFGYVGPGAGLSAIGTVLALIGAVLLALFGFIWYPVKRFIAKRRARATAAKEAAKQPVK